MSKHADEDRWLSEIDLARVEAMLLDNGVTEVIYKVLPRNANSKNQVYLASDFSQISKIPSGEVTVHDSTSEKSGKQEGVFRAPLEFYWLDQDGVPHLAPDAKLIFYPQFPEVRLSGFLKGCRRAPSSLWAKEKRGEEPNRILVLGLGHGRKIIAITLPPESPAAREIRLAEPREPYGVFSVLPMPGQQEISGFQDLMRHLCLISRQSWVDSTRLDRDGKLVPCNASNCNGNTLESLLGIRSNGFSQPDFRGWEVKARQVANSDSPGVSTVTLFTPEPTGGLYSELGVVEFVRLHGYPDTKGRVDRMNFGGVYRSGKDAHHRTGLRLVLDGFDSETGNYNPTGALQLLDRKDRVAAAWPFAKLMEHWKAKHACAAFVPSQRRTVPSLQYRFGRKIQLGEGAEFKLFLAAVAEGRIYYDPGIKLEGVSTGSPKAKKRSQFRVGSKHLPLLYVTSRIVDACEEAGR